MDTLHAGLMPALWVTNVLLAGLVVVLAAVLIRSRRASAVLREGEARLRFAVRVSEIGVFDHDQRTGEIYWSPEMCSLYGCTDTERPSIAEFLARVYSEDRAAVVEAIERAHDPQRQGLFDLQHRLVRPDGEVRWLALRSVTLFEGEGASRRAVRTVGTAVDFTERKRVEDALRQSEERLRQAVRVSQFGIYDHDQESDRIWWSPEQRQNYGFSADEPVTLEKFVECVFPDDRARIAAAVQRAHDPSGDGLFDVEHRIVRRDGQVRWLVTRSRTFFAGEGPGRHPIRTIGAVLDVTDRRHAEEQLRRLNSIHLTLSHTNQAIVRASSEAELLERSCQIAVEYGGFALVWIGLLDQDGFLPAVAAAGPARAYLDGIKVTVNERLSEGRGPSGEALRSGAHVIVNDFASSERMRPWWERGRAFGIESSAAFPLFGAGRVIGALCVYSTVRDHFGEREISLLDDMAADISFGLESLDRAAALDRSLKQLRDVEAAVRVGAFRVVLPDWSLWWSEGTPAVLGLPAATTADRTALEAAVGPEIASILSAALEEAAQTGTPIDIDLPLRLHSVTAHWVRLFGVPRRRDDGTTEVSCTVQDISERKRLESEVARAAYTERRRLASELHDNLGQILFGTSMLLSSIVREAQTTGSALLGRIEQTTQAMHDALQVCRTLAHGAAPVVEGDLSAALRELAERTAAAGVECIAITSETANTVVTGARALELYRIAQEAITNALKHAQCRRIEIELALHGLALELSIRDDGEGIDRSGPGGGEGIGLRTMRYRAARAGGTLEFRSKPAHGTIVRVRVPLLAEEHAVPVAAPDRFYSW
jgi:PAS domain S-box-containing protein